MFAILSKVQKPQSSGLIVNDTQCICNVQHLDKIKIHFDDNNGWQQLKINFPSEMPLKIAFILAKCIQFLVSKIT